MTDLALQSPLPDQGAGALGRLPRLRLGPLPAFVGCGLAGLGAAVGLALTLVARWGLPPWPMGLVVVQAVAAFLLLALAAKVVTGREVLVFYHHLVVVATGAAALLALLRQPVLAYLDATVLGIGAFLCLGRVGCLLVGCCHGRPARWGVTYSSEHADHGFPRCFVGVRLFPVQALEAVWVAVVVAVTAAATWGGPGPGEALASFVVAYAAGRFVLETARGDAGRPCVVGASHGQWTSVVLAVATAVAGAVGVLPPAPWRGATAGLLAAALALLVFRHLRRGESLLSARHIKELAQAVPLLAAAADSAVAVLRTSLGLRLSTGAAEAGVLAQYALSCDGRHLTPREVRRLVALLVYLRHTGCRTERRPGRHGVIHALVLPAAVQPRQ